jgi:hypothetical protein
MDSRELWKHEIKLIGTLGTPENQWSLLSFYARKPLVGQGLLIVEASRSHLNTPHSIGLLWTSDQPDGKTSTWQHTTFTRDRHPCPLSGIRTRNPCRRAAADPSLRSSGHRDRQWNLLLTLYSLSTVLSNAVPNPERALAFWKFLRIRRRKLSWTLCRTKQKAINYIQQSPCREAVGSLGSQEIPWIVWNPPKKVRYSSLSWGILIQST